MSKSKAPVTGQQPKRPAQNPLEEVQTYNVGKAVFIVEPMFKTDAKDTLGTVLLRLIQSDTEVLDYQ